MTHEELIRLAIEARESAYAPFSKYTVGAAILTSDGKVWTGANVENSSYGLTVCAERVAIFKAVTGGSRRLSVIAVATETGASMCGACRQVAAEFGVDATVLLTDAAGRATTTTVDDLLPGSFRLDHD